MVGSSSELIRYVIMDSTIAPLRRPNGTDINILSDSEPPEPPPLNTMLSPAMSCKFGGKSLTSTSSGTTGVIIGCGVAVGVGDGSWNGVGVGADGVGVGSGVGSTVGAAVGEGAGDGSGGDTAGSLVTVILPSAGVNATIAPSRSFASLSSTLTLIYASPRGAQSKMVKSILINVPVVPLFVVPNHIDRKGLRLYVSAFGPKNDIPLSALPRLTSPGSLICNLVWSY